MSILPPLYHTHGHEIAQGHMREGPEAQRGREVNSQQRKDARGLSRGGGPACGITALQ